MYVRARLSRNFKKRYFFFLPFARQGVKYRFQGKIKTKQICFILECTAAVKIVRVPRLFHVICALLQRTFVHIYCNITFPGSKRNVLQKIHRTQFNIRKQLVSDFIRRYSLAGLRMNCVLGVSYVFDLSAFQTPKKSIRKS